MGRPRSVVDSQIVGGADASLTDTRVLALPINWGGDWRKLRMHSEGYPLKGATIEDRVARCNNIARGVRAFAAMQGVAVMAIENYAFNQRNRSHHLGELGGVLRSELMAEGVKLAEPTASAARLLLMGEAPRKKTAFWKEPVKERVRLSWERVGFPHVSDEDACDAMTILNLLLSNFEGAFFFRSVVV